MKHGSSCDCMICSLLKKVGVIKSQPHEHGGGFRADVCKRCGQLCREDGKCGCGHQ